MSWTSRVGGLLRLLFHRQRLENELDAEVQTYFDMLVDRYVKRGLSSKEARRLVRMNFEGPEQVKEKVRDVRTGARIASMSRDVRYALRTVRKNPAFATLTILTLALGIGVTTAIFSVVYAVLLQPLPYRDPGKLVLLFQSSAQDLRQPLLLSDYELLKTQSQSFQDIAVFYKNTGFSRVILTGTTEPESVQGAYVSANLFPLLGISPLLGRAFTPYEQAQSERVIVLSYRQWRRRFGSRPDICGRTLEIDGASFKIIGVMPEEFQFPARDSEFWAPITTNRFWLDRPNRDNAHTLGFYARWNVVARLRPAISLEQARAEMKLFGPRLREKDPNLNDGLGFTAVPLEVDVSGNTRLALLILFAAVSFLLLIACVNAAHLMLARGAGRQQEIAVRLSLGARQGDLLRQLVTESVVLSLLAALCGVALAAAAVRALIAYSPGDVPRIEQASVNTEVLAFTLGASFVAAILFGFLPAWRFSRTPPNDALKSSGRTSSASAGLSRTRACLVMAEFALTVVLLTGAGLLIRSFLAVQSVDPGFNPEHVLTVRVGLPAGAKDASFYDQALERIAGIPGVRAAGAVSGLFEQGTSDLGSLHASEPPRITGNRLRVWANWKSIRGDYFQAMGIPLLRGRFFTSQDRPDEPLVALIDQSMARRYWPGEDAVGKRFRGQDARGRADDPLLVIGIIHDTRSRGRDAEPTPHVFQPAAQTEYPASMNLVIRTAGDPVKLGATIRAIVRSMDRTTVISSITTMEQQLNEQVSPRRFQTWLLSVFSLLALILASGGIYGVMHYAVVQRTHEIGIRMALGAEPGNLLKMVLKEGLLMMAPGLITGLLASWWLTTLLRGMLFEVKSTDPLTYLGVGLLLTVVAAAAVAVPAWRAARVDPLEALRQE